MTTRTPARRLTRRLTALTACVGLLLSGCGTAHSGTAVPNAAAAAKYVSKKFEDSINNLNKEIHAQEDKKVRLERYLRLDERWLDGTIEGARRGSPPDRSVKIADNKNPANQRVILQPPGKREYMYLGGVYSSLAPTPWVSLPSTTSGGWECTWSGAQDACKIVDAIAATVKADPHAVRSAKSLSAGDTEVRAAMTYDAFLESRVIVLPQDASDEIRKYFGDKAIRVRIILSEDSKLKEITLDGKEANAEHKLELRMKYQNLGEPNDSDFPKKPRKQDITDLRTKKQVDKFHDGLDELHGS